MIKVPALPLLKWKVSSFSSAEVLTGQIARKKDLRRFCLFVWFFFPACVRAGTAFKKTPSTLEDRNAPEGASGEGTCCWDQCGSWWVLSNTGRWKISVGEKDASTSICHKTGVECPVCTTSGLCPAFNLPNSCRFGVQRSAMPGSGWALDSFLDNFAQHHWCQQKSLPQGFQLEPLFPGVSFLIN